MKISELKTRIAEFNDDDDLITLETAKTLLNGLSPSQLERFGFEVTPDPIVIGDILQLGLLVVTYPKTAPALAA